MFKRFYLCYNDRTAKIFNIGYIDNCPPLYLKSMYHLIMRLKFNPRELGIENEKLISMNCFKEIVLELKDGNYLQPQHGIYIVDYTYNGLNEEIDNFISFASSVNSTVGVDVHEIDVFSPDESEFSSNSTNTSSSLMSQSDQDLLQSTDEELQNQTDEDMEENIDEDSQQNTDLDTAMYIDNYNEE